MPVTRAAFYRTPPAFLLHSPALHISKRCLCSCRTHLRGISQNAARPSLPGQSSSFPSPHLCGFTFFSFSIRTLILLFSACPFGTLCRPAAFRTVRQLSPVFHISYSTAPLFLFSFWHRTVFSDLNCVRPAFHSMLPAAFPVLPFRQYPSRVFPHGSLPISCPRRKKAIRKNNFRIASKPPSETSGYRKKSVQLYFLSYRKKPSPDAIPSFPSSIYFFSIFSIPLKL